MKGKLLVLLLVFAGRVWAGGSPATGSESAALARGIESASGVILSDEQPSSEEMQGALADLLQTASAISRSAGLPAPTQKSLDLATAAYAEGRFLEPPAVAKVHRAYEAVSGDRAFAFPQEVGSIEEARDHGRRQIQNALRALEVGRSKEAIQEILGLVLLVTTPMKCD